MWMNNWHDRGSLTQINIPSYHDMIVCLGFYVPLENSYGDVTITCTGEGLQILTSTWHSLPLSSEGSSACHTYCDMGHPFIMVNYENPWHSLLLLSVWQWSCHYLFLRLWSVAAGIRTPNLPHVGLTLWTTAPPRLYIMIQRRIHFIIQ